MIKEIFLVFIIVIATNIAWLLKPLTTFPVYYIDFIIVPVFFIYVIVTGKIKIFIEDILIPLFIFLTFISFFKTVIYDDEPILSALKASKFDFLLLFYFVIKYIPLNIKRINNVILMFGFLLSFVMIYAAITQNDVLFQIAYLDKEVRYGFVRYVIGIPLISYCCIYTFIQLIYSFKIINIIAFSYFFCIVSLVFMTRSVTLSIVATLLAIFIYNKKINKFVTIYIVILILSSFYILTLDNSIINNKILSNSSKELNNLSARKVSHLFFLKELKKHPVIGRGEFWPDSKKYYEKDEFGRKVHGSDVGHAAILYKHGIVGAIWIVLFFYFTLFKFRERVDFKMIDQYFYFFLFCLLAGVTLDFFTDQNNKAFVFLIFAMYARVYRQCRNDSDIELHYRESL